MKNQKGFTLIELLLVLAIIGIISAIAIPALLSQRSRARDKSSISNMTGRMGDLVGQYDKVKEAGTAQASIAGALGTYLTATGGGDKNPWDPATAAFDTTVHPGAATDQTTALAEAAALAIVKGQATFGIVFPTAGVPGFIEGGVLCDNTQSNGTLKVTKATAIE
jgi:prepilin-type N-terminal cleavage/methylation domain-containing protein